jgi:hypothetical protein
MPAQIERFVRQAVFAKILRRGAGQQPLLVELFGARRH